MLAKAVTSRLFDRDAVIEFIADRCAQAGFSGVELDLEEHGAYALDITQDRCADLLSILDQRRLTVTSLTSELFWKHNLGSARAESRHRAEEIVLAMLDRAVWLQATSIQVVPAVVGRAGAEKESDSYERAVTRAWQGLHHLLPEAERRGVRIAVRSFGGRFILSPVEMRQFVDQLNSWVIGVALNLDQVSTYGDAGDWIRTLGRYVDVVSLGGADRSPSRCAPVDAASALGEVDYTGPITYQGTADLAAAAAVIEPLCTAVGGARDCPA